LPAEAGLPQGSVRPGMASVSPPSPATSSRQEAGRRHRTRCRHGIGFRLTGRCRGWILCHGGCGCGTRSRCLTATPTLGCGRMERGKSFRRSPFLLEEGRRECANLVTLCFLACSRARAEQCQRAKRSSSSTYPADQAFVGTRHVGAEGLARYPRTASGHLVRTRPIAAGEMANYSRTLHDL
jgi:hypothetical protein